MSTGKPYDGHMLKQVLRQTDGLTGQYPKTAPVDSGYKGVQHIAGTTIIKPSRPLKRENHYQRNRKRKHCRRRAVTEPVIGPIKDDHRAARNYLKGTLLVIKLTSSWLPVPSITAASAFNYKKRMKKLRAKALWFSWQTNTINQYWILNFSRKTKSSFLRDN